ncbi:phage holin, lambda family [Actinobacillus pleuropneumoniae]|uniref:Phage holin, lambda family n=2 Tax=Actinobacillus pleuropneumoniae TaxID=715 RepID=A0ABM6X5N8_ACTPL|nr:phage holin, lambda family [Actinobacillus pleuropneumoniae]AWG96465.1 phage holin, lambda family [Actinobacillus pleuropneumoniae serovar 1 str. 4074]AXA22535.1 phage holin, lambda family [Actinobacillus pleuropneumoniae]MBL4535040.1 phage holin, lambda family [Actinobacillus pleuropneumoniae]MCI1069457.1 phage holin, lambda family [Actinobacillus pleuropneumoniae]MCL7709110.1 phage holin, lambda family [Actinobacillus pleuropneumoniae]
MPEKNPDVWGQIWNFIAVHLVNHNQLICGVVIAMFTSVTKSFLYGKTDTAKRVLAEAVLCGVLAGVSRPILEVSGLSIDLITPIGAMIGLAGTSAIRQLILKFINRKIDGVDNNAN